MRWVSINPFFYVHLYTRRVDNSKYNLNLSYVYSGWCLYITGLLDWLVIHFWGETQVISPRGVLLNLTCRICLCFGFCENEHMINKMWNDSEKLERMAEILQKKKKKTGRYVYTIYSVLLTPFSYVKKKIKFECNTAASANSQLFHLFVSFIQHFSTGHPSPLCIVPPRRSCRPLTVGDKLLQLLPLPGFFLFFFFFYGRGWVTLVCSTARDWLLAAPLSPLLPWQCCTVIDKVDKEMLGHAPDRLDLKSPRWRERQQPDSIH